MSQGIRRTLQGLAVFAAIASSAVACSRAPKTVGADVWAVVDDHEIRQADVEKAYRRVAPQPNQVSTIDEELTTKLGLVDELITQEVLLAKARSLKIDVTDAEVETAFSDRRRNMTDDAFQRELQGRGLSADDMKQALRRELTTDRLLEREVSSKIAITDQEISDFYNKNRAQFNVAETQYRIAQIVVTPMRDAQNRNRLHDDATTPEQAQQKVTLLMGRLKSGTPFSALAMDYSEDPQTAPQGGDLGYIPASALAQVPQQLRDTVLKTEPGNVSVVSAGGAHTLVLLVAREQAGQRELTTPSVRDGINSTLRERKEQLQRAAFVTVSRNNAKIVNYLARMIAEGHFKPAAPPPQLAPKGPGK
jgi:peptidyl-prolyl cis-trans isomerase SurA